MKFAIHLLLIFFTNDALAFNEPYFVSLEKKLDSQSGTWFFDLFQKRLKLEENKKIQATSLWHSEFEVFLTALLNRQKIKDEEYHSLWLNNLKACLIKENIEVNQNCIQTLLLRYRNIYGAVFFEEKILLLQDQFFQIINKKKDFKSIEFSFLLSACVYATSVPCLNRLKSLFPKIPAELSTDALASLSLIESSLNNSDQANLYIELLLKKIPEKNIPVSEAQQAAHIYLFREECQKGIDILNKITETSDISTKNRLNTALIKSELFRLCEKEFQEISQLAKILPEINRDDLYLRLKTITEIAVLSEISSTSKYKNLLASELTEIEKKMAQQAYSPRLQLIKIILSDSIPAKNIQYQSLQKKLASQKNSESQYVFQALKMLKK